MPDITTLIKKSDYDTKIAETASKYVSNTGFDSKLAQANVITKRNFDAKIIGLENNIKKLQTLIVCSCHVTYAFQSESTLYSCLNVKELFARSRCEI